MKLSIVNLSLVICDWNIDNLWVDKMVYHNLFNTNVTCNKIFLKWSWLFVAMFIKCENSSFSLEYYVTWCSLLVIVLIFPPVDYTLFDTDVLCASRFDSSFVFMLLLSYNTFTMLTSKLNQLFSLKISTGRYCRLP